MASSVGCPQEKRILKESFRWVVYPHPIRLKRVPITPGRLKYKICVGNRTNHFLCQVPRITDDIFKYAQPFFIAVGWRDPSSWSLISSLTPELILRKYSLYQYYSLVQFFQIILGKILLVVYVPKKLSPDSNHLPAIVNKLLFCHLLFHHRIMSIRV